MSKSKLDQIIANPALLLPRSPLHVHRVLSPLASVRVSPLCFGAMNLGDAHERFMGSIGGKAGGFQMLDYFFEQGGNFIDTANGYQDQQSEQWLGEWMEERGNRDQMVIATKYSTGYMFKQLDRSKSILSHTVGNSTKSMALSVKNSLKNLRTDYIDILYVHWWDWTTSIPEVCQSLNQLVLSGKVLYLGISDTPAWVVSQFNQYARDHGMRPFSVYQGRWSAAVRDFERDIIPMCRSEGMALAPWGSLGSGHFKTKEQRETSDGRGGPNALPAMQHSRHAEAVTEVLDTIGKRKGVPLTSVALAYVMHKTPYVFPIVGGRKIEHLKANIEALELELSDDDMKEIESAYPFEVGFPLDMLGGSRPDGNWLMHMAGKFDYVEAQKPIKPHT